MGSISLLLRVRLSLVPTKFCSVTPRFRGSTISETFVQDFVPLGEPHRNLGVREFVLHGNLVGSRYFKCLLLNSAPSTCCDFRVAGYRNELFVFNMEVVWLNSSGDFHSGKSCSAAPQSHGSLVMSLPGRNHVNRPSLIPGQSQTQQNYL